jgi:hypothetical protein
MGLHGPAIRFRSIKDAAALTGLSGLNVKIKECCEGRIRAIGDLCFRFAEEK